MTMTFANNSWKKKFAVSHDKLQPTRLSIANSKWRGTAPALNDQIPSQTRFIIRHCYIILILHTCLKTAFAYILVKIEFRRFVEQNKNYIGYRTAFNLVPLYFSITFVRVNAIHVQKTTWQDCKDQRVDKESKSCGEKMA